MKLLAPRTAWRLAMLLGAAGLLFLAGCGTVGYYLQSASGHMSLMQAAKPIDVWMQDTQTPETLKARLVLAQRIRRFAVDELKLPDNKSYQRYADLQRKAAVWNVVAAPEFSLQAKTWCFPVAGCVAYKGFFDEAKAEAEAGELRAQGLEASVYPVPAYSTLGWLNWAGGDPLLNTFISYPEGELARIIFHELAHQVLYAPGDTVFNESFATAVERLGGERWLAQHGNPAMQQEYAVFNTRRVQFRALTLALRQRLSDIYASKSTVAQAPPAQAAMKKIAMDEFHQNYATLKKSWGGYAGYDAWVARTNNASLAALEAYDELVPGFEALFMREGGDWPRFYDACKELAAKPKQARHEALKTFTNSTKEKSPHG